MNTYNMTKDYYNYANNNYNQPLYNQNIQNKQIYDPYNGFIRGNMFPELYNSYKLNKPLEITPMNEQAELLTYVDALTFAMIDLNLYLDVYPIQCGERRLHAQSSGMSCGYRDGVCPVCGFHLNRVFGRP